MIHAEVFLALAMGFIAGLGAHGFSRLLRLLEIRNRVALGRLKLFAALWFILAMAGAALMLLGGVYAVRGELAEALIVYVAGAVLIIGVWVSLRRPHVAEDRRS